MEGGAHKDLGPNEGDEQTKEEMQLRLEDRRAAATHLGSLQGSLGQGSLWRKIEY